MPDHEPWDTRLDECEFLVRSVRIETHCIYRMEYDDYVDCSDRVAGVVWQEIAARDLTAKLLEASYDFREVFYADT